MRVAVNKGFRGIRAASHKLRCIFDKNQLRNPAQDYDYGYRQGNIQVPFGHQWMIEMKI